MANYQPTIAQIRETGVHQRIADRDTLSGLDEIAAYMNCSINTVRRLIKKSGLPAGKSVGRGGIYFTTKTHINAWVIRRHTSLVVENDWLNPERSVG